MKKDIVSSSAQFIVGAIVAFTIAVWFLMGVWYVIHLPDRKIIVGGFIFVIGFLCVVSVQARRFILSIPSRLFRAGRVFFMVEK